MNNFWQELTKPFTVLAPMDDVTDNVFRQVVMSTARPDVFMTEFANVDGLVSDGKEKVLKKLKFEKSQHPIVAQVWGNNPDNFFKVAKLVKKLGFDGMDINMGCPIKDVVKKGCGAGLIGNYDLVSNIIEASKKGLGNIPLSVKTRLGLRENIADEWLSFLLTQGLSALTLHARIASQMSGGMADWKEIGKVVKLRNEISPETVIIGNGDIKSYKEVLDVYEKYKIDGVMIGRGIFANPWVFEKELNSKKHTKTEYVSLLLKHLELSQKEYGLKGFPVTKKFFKMYINGFPGASKLRQRLIICKTYTEVKEILKNDH